MRRDLGFTGVGVGKMEGCESLFPSQLCSMPGEMPRVPALVRPHSAQNGTAFMSVQSHSQVCTCGVDGQSCPQSSLLQPCCYPSLPLLSSPRFPLPSLPSCFESLIVFQTGFALVIFLFPTLEQGNSRCILLP